MARASSALTSRGRSSRRRGSARIPPDYRRDPDLALLERLLARRAGAADDARARAARRARARRPAARARHRRLARPQRTRPPPRRTPPSTAASARSRTSSTRCGPLTHRDPGIVGAALVRPDVVVQAIVDGVHLDPDIVRLLWSVAAGRFALVTDAIAAAGLGDGDYALGGVDIDGPRRRRPPERRRARGQRVDDDRGASGTSSSSASRSSGAAEAASLVPAGVLGLGDARPARRRPAGPTSSCSTTTSRSSASSSEGRPVSPAEAIAPARDRSSAPRSASSRPRSSACSSTTRRSRASRATAARRGVHARAHGRATARPTTRRRTASTRSGCCRAGRRCATRSR